MTPCTSFLVTYLFYPPSALPIKASMLPEYWPMAIFLIAYRGLGEPVSHGHLLFTLDNDCV